MKKNIIYILLAITLAITAFMATASANSATATPEINMAHENTMIAVTAPTIPKPDLLPGPGPDRITGEEGGGTARNILTETILPFFAIGLIGFVGGLSLVMLIISGVRFAMAYGNEEAITKAKSQAMYSLVGFLIALLSYTIVTIVINLRIGGDTTQRAQETAAPTVEDNNLQDENTIEEQQPYLNTGEDPLETDF
ncbi:MAG: hypothetical protein ABIH78_00380 [Candidatus Peregrinibacteria bacterium]